MRWENERLPARLGLIGNPENRRIQDFRRALHKIGSPPPTLLSYQELLRNDDSLANFDAQVVRIDSPGENAHVAQKLIALGGGPPKADLEFGEIAHSKAYHDGYCHLLRQLGVRPSSYLNAPDEIAVMFDKWVCHQRFRDHGVARPPAKLAPPSYDQLREQSSERGGQLFLKPLHGSSASGVCALRWRPGQTVLFAPLRIVEGRLLNCLQVQRYQDACDISLILNRLLPQGMIAETWIPKLTLSGGAVDLRVLVIAGRARHRVVRQSRHPMTNLHLGNRRLDWNHLLQRIGPSAAQAALELAERAAGCFPESLSAGVDILLDTSGRSYVAEINAFGDLLPGLSHQGESAYTALAKEMCARAV